METPKETKLVKPDGSAQKMVRIRTKKPIRLMRPHPHKKDEYVEDVIPEDRVVEVTEEEAAEFCRKIEGQHGYAGERYDADGDVKRYDLTRAVRV